MTAVLASASADADAEVHLEYEFAESEFTESDSDSDSNSNSNSNSKVDSESVVGEVDESILELTANTADEGAADSDDPKAEAVAPADPSHGDTSRAVTEMSDEELLVGIRLQSDLHFTELYNRYFQRIYSFVYTRIRNHAETEEVVQETFLAVFRSFERYRGQSSVLSWIYGIAKNTANNSIRRAKSQRERIDLADEEDLVPRQSLSGASPGEQLDLNRFQNQLTMRLEGLADWQAEIFEMRHFENLSIPEISKRTTRSSDAVRSSLYRVKRIFLEAAHATGTGALLTGEQA